jgi:hypothetical protein
MNSIARECGSPQGLKLVMKKRPVIAALMCCTTRNKLEN